MWFKNLSAIQTPSDTNYALFEIAVNQIHPAHKKLVHIRQTRSPKIAKQPDKERWQKAKNDETETLNHTID